MHGYHCILDNYSIQQYIPNPRISIPIKNSFSVLCPEFIRNHWYQFFGSLKIHGNPSPKCFEFFLVIFCHKPVMYNALLEWLKMELIDAKHFSFIFERIVLLVQYHCSFVWKNKFCKWIPKAENGTWELFFGLVVSRPRYRKLSLPWNPRAWYSISHMPCSSYLSILVPPSN